MQMTDDFGRPIPNSQYNVPIPAGPLERHDIQTVINSLEQEKGEDQNLIESSIAKS
jgi:hypothetical protein